jgi:DNA repair exonuclease SbcCD ATPase subunit
MKKIILIVLVLFIVVTPNAFATNMDEMKSVMRMKEASSAGMKKEMMQEKITGNLQERAAKEISRRISSLQEKLTKIDSMEKLTDEQKTALKKQVQNEITVLQALLEKIKSSADTATLRTDVQSIVKEHRVYSMFMPKLTLLAAANRLNNTAEQMSSLSAKLQIRIDEAKTAGKDVSEAETSLADMQEKIADAKKQSAAAIAAVTPLTVEGYPENKTILMSAREMIQTGQQDLVAARKDVNAIRKVFYAGKETVTPTVTLSESPLSPSPTE